MNANLRGIVSNLTYCRDLAAAALQKSIGTKQWVSLKQVSITLETADQLRFSQILILGNRSNFAEVLRIVSNRIPKPASSVSCFGHSCSRHYEISKGQLKPASPPFFLRGWLRAPCAQLLLFVAFAVARHVHQRARGLLRRGVAHPRRSTSLHGCLTRKEKRPPKNCRVLVWSLPL